MKNEKSFIKYLKEKLKNNIVAFYSDDGHKDKFQENRERLFTLLSDHPYFTRRVIQIREKYQIPKDGFEDESAAFLFEHKYKDTKLNFTNTIEELVNSFKIPQVYRQSVWHFSYDYLIYPKRAERQIIERLPLVRIVKTDRNREINKYLVSPNSTYIEVFNWTTRKDAEKALKKFNKSKTIQLPFKVSKVGPLARAIWKLSQGGLNNKEIKVKVNKMFKESGDSRIFGETDVAVYKKNYKDALSVLRKIK